MAPTQSKCMAFLRPARLIVILLLVTTLAWAADAEIKPKKTGYAVADISIKWNLDLQGEKLTQLQVKSFGFLNSPSQKVISEATLPVSPIETDEFGNNLRVFDLNAIENFQSFTLDSQVQVQFKFDFRKASDASSFLSESPYVKITPEIRQRAESIAAAYKTDMEKATAIAEWVHNNVRYDRNYINIVKGSDSVYTERAGTCDEFSHLFIAMLRSIGIPAKFSASFVYGGDEWGPHAFVEAAIEGKWIPFDPTFNEAIILDATHIKFGEGLDQGDIVEEIITRGFDADPSRVKLTREFEITFKETQNFPELFTMELILPEKEAGEGSIEVVKAIIRNKQHRMAVPLSLSTPQEMKIVGENKVKEDKLVLLAPFEEREVEWKIILPSLEEGYDYKFPLVLESLGQEINGTIHASKDADVSRKEDLKVIGISAKEDAGNLQLIAIVKNVGNVYSEGKVSMLIEGAPDQGKDFAIGPGAEYSAAFSIPGSAGVKDFEGTLILETENLRLTQPFEFSLGASEKPVVQPTFQRPADSPLPARKPDAAGGPEINAEYLVFFGAIALVLAIFAVKAARG